MQPLLIQNLSQTHNTASPKENAGEDKLLQEKGT